MDHGVTQEIQKIQTHAKSKQKEEVVFTPPGSLQCDFSLSSYRKLTLRFHILEGYPAATPVALQFTSPTLKQKLIGKLLKQAETKAQQALEKKQEHVWEIYNWASEILYESRLFLCWDQVFRIKKEVIREKFDSFKFSDKTGVLTFKCDQGKFHCQFTLSVPYEYPAKEPELKIKSCNFPKEVYEPYLNEANEIGRRCRLGYPPGYGEEGFAKNRKFFDGTMKKIQKEIQEKYEGKMTTTQVKHDLQFLRTQADLKQRQNEKKARYNLKKMVAKETEKELQRLQEIKEEEKQAFAAVGRTQGQQKSVFYMADYFLNYFIHLIPKELCPLCERAIFTEKASKKTEKAYCGHWYHLDCMEKQLSCPPFRKKCKKCEDFLSSPLFPVDDIAIKNRERMWAMQQARDAELDALEDDLFQLE